MRGILTYHAIDRSGSPIAVTPEAFRSHVEWLASGAVRVVSLEELLRLSDAEDAVAITFDDALESIAAEAAPLLALHHLPATVFVVTQAVGRDNRWSGRGDPGIPVASVLDWPALHRLQEQGFTIGAHSRTHPNLCECNALELVEEVAGSADDIAMATGVRPRTFAYPYGALNAQVTATVAAEFDIACTTEFLGLSQRTLPSLTPRLDAWYFRDAARLSRWGSPGFARWVARRHLLRRVRGWIG